MDNNWKKAFEVLKNGGIVIFPTDTTFGIGCRIDSEQSIERLFEIRKRPLNQAVPVLFSSVEMVMSYVLGEINPKVKKLINKYWPGALTVVFPANLQKAPSLVRGGGKTVGVRIPDKEELRNVINKLGVPILGPSANFHGDKTPYKFNDLNKNLVSLADFVISGETVQSKPSTVIDVSTDKWKILRQGAVKIESWLK